MSEKTEQKRIVLEQIIGAAIQFGAAIGSWHDSRILWQQFAGSDCVEAIKNRAVSEIQIRLGEIERNCCEYCHQEIKPPE